MHVSTSWDWCQWCTGPKWPWREWFWAMRQWTRCWSHWPESWVDVHGQAGKGCKEKDKDGDVRMTYLLLTLRTCLNEDWLVTSHLDEGNWFAVLFDITNLFLLIEFIRGACQRNGADHHHWVGVKGHWPECGPETYLRTMPLLFLEGGSEDKKA